ncbi:TonB-dependent receptor [Novosphingobium sp.]|uniref:TonB-dependent receptor n=1 Tax=Novosphingobium sp. TaxID=1874826 RepID=UPI00260CAFAA|nr:TonB-dependent receptor [Novosphingobium sp.]
MSTAPLALVLIPSAAWADDASAPGAESYQIVVYGRAIGQVGVATSGSQGVVGFADFEDRPIGRVGELAENVPGLIATQHSGSGKGNQYFLRGFNLDHGTDLAGYVDGAPINMRSHGHGQGYLDLNFLIPEMVERIDYTKGPYHAAEGDFSSAGTMRYTTKSRLARPFAEVTGGSFGYWRGLVAGSADLGDGTLLGALDATASNGPWVLDEHERKLIALIKYSAADWSLGLSGYTNSWVSTDQVPERAINLGLIPRNGFIDPDLGGRAGRVALTFNGQFGDTQVSAYAIGSRLQLTSNFTYFLDDPSNGDEFRQVDRRGVFGGSVRHVIKRDMLTWRFGADTRWDRIGKVGLYRTVAGTVVGTVREDRVDEFSGGLFGEAEFQLGPRVRFVAGLRGDAIGYNVRSDLAANADSGSAAIVSPKAALAWQPGKGVEFYANYGEGHHSNDVRGATVTVDPSDGTPVSQVAVFARSRGAELGTRLERGNFNFSLVGFWLNLESELVFVGDAGTTEPNDASCRYGTEAALFWHPVPGVTIDGTASWTHARFRGVAPGQDFIPGATPFVLGGGISAKLTTSITATARVRHFASAPLVEDNSKRSEATTLVNLGGYWEIARARIGLEVLNLFDASDPDISYWYASRLPGEPVDGIEDRHIHPVEPRQARLSVRFSF